MATINCHARQIAGTWSAVREIDGQPTVYELTLTEKGSNLNSTWSVEGRWTSEGCLKGPRGNRVAVLSSCIIDGSHGARDSAAICPTYADRDRRFTTRGTTLV